MVKTLTKLRIILIGRLCNTGNLHLPNDKKREKAETFSLHSQFTQLETHYVCTRNLAICRKDNKFPHKSFS